MAKIRTGFLIDTSRCIGCRACQVACKQWNKLAPDKTVNEGSYENPNNLTPNLYNRIKFVEKADDKGDVKWLFMNERCVHCAEAGCMKVCPAPGALTRSEDGVVEFDKDKCISCKYCVFACPFDVPRYGDDGKVSKCHLCTDRIGAGMQPACSKACPTNTLQFGRRNSLLAMAKKIASGNGKKVYGESDLGGLGVLYVLEESPDTYGLPAKPSIPANIFLWKDIIKPLGILGFWASIAGVLLHYVTFHPEKLDEETMEKGGTEND